MPRKKKEKILMVGDFETTCYPGQKNTEVWASALCELYKPESQIKIFNSIGKTFTHLSKYSDKHIIIYYHNLRFDGAFWLDYLLKKGFKNAYKEISFTVNGEECKSIDFVKLNELKENELNYIISQGGTWYRVGCKCGSNIIEFRDSLKLIPSSVEKMANSYNTKCKKLNIQYVKKRRANGILTDEEKDYLKNDVLIVKEVLEKLFDENEFKKSSKLTIGSYCLDEFRNMFYTDVGVKYEFKKRQLVWEDYFPDLANITVPNEKQENYDIFLRPSYRGGWCYVNPKHQGRVINEKGYTIDGNSLYPSVMHSLSGNPYPVGNPQYIRNWAEMNNVMQDKKLYYFIRFKCHFSIKDGYFPFVQIRNHARYTHEILEDSGFYLKEYKKYQKYYMDMDGEIKSTAVELTMTMTDFELFKRHYNIQDFEFIDGCSFKTQIGLFDRYINKYYRMKSNSSGAEYERSKLFLNNLGGKFGTNPTNDFKICELGTDDMLEFTTLTGKPKKSVYLPIACAMTAYGREITITLAQLNHDNFLYSDTDSLHLIGDISDCTGVMIDPKKLMHWKLEAIWDSAIFHGTKRYIEHRIDKKTNFFDIKCAGMPASAKEILAAALQHKKISKIENDDIFTVVTFSDGSILKCSFNDDVELLKKGCDLSDFKRGLKVGGCLKSKRCPGGVILYDDVYKLR